MQHTLQTMNDFQLLGYNPNQTLMEVNLKHSDGDSSLLSEKTSNRRFDGKIPVISMSKPDISFSIRHLSQFR